MTTAWDNQGFRTILGHYPTGVCAVTAISAGMPVGMIVGSFTSVSLTPPLVAFFPARSSTSWPLIQESGRFCVNVLAHDQDDICKTLSIRGKDKFQNINFRQSTNGQPILTGVVAWIDCTLDAVHEAGDHLIAVGRVEGLDLEHSGQPLLFLRGGYGMFAPLCIDPS